MCSPIWGTFIHVPKCGGTWIRHMLKAMDKNAWEDGFPHSLPIAFDDCWAVVRDPVDWHRSAYAQRVKDKWVRYGKILPWREYCNMIGKCTWQQYLYRITHDLQGLCHWLFTSYTPPAVKVYRLEDTIYDKLREVGVDLDEKISDNQRNVTPDCYKYTIPDDVAEQIREYERGVYERWYP